MKLLDNEEYSKDKLLKDMIEDDFYYNEMNVKKVLSLSLIHISEPTRPLYISYAVFCLKK